MINLNGQSSGLAVFFIEQIMIILRQLFHSWLAWVLVILSVLVFFACKFFYNVDNIPALAAVITGSIIMFGYFATHDLEIKRKQREKKLEVYMKIMKNLRFLIMEKHLKESSEGQLEMKKMRDELQDIYFPFSLLTSEKSYNALKGMMKAFDLHLVKNNSDSLIKFKKAQSNFVNKLRNELFIDKEIDFTTFDFMIGKSKQKLE